MLFVPLFRKGVSFGESWRSAGGFLPVEAFCLEKVGDQQEAFGPLRLFAC
jgi:hypothetical protein